MHAKKALTPISALFTSCTYTCVWSVDDPRQDDQLITTPSRGRREEKEVLDLALHLTSTSVHSNGKPLFQTW